MEAEVSDLNREFWNELCGSHLAKSLGVTDDSPESLALFDDWFMQFYPYLSRHIPFSDFQGKKVLEVGLGYGSVSQKIAEAGAEYTALDVAEGPVRMVRHRLNQNSLRGEAISGSILQAPFDSDTFDFVVAIGCYHHTGNMQRAIDETWRILRPGGQAIIMVYNALSYRRWIWSFSDTWQYFRGLQSGDYQLFNPSALERGDYDANSEGHAAPHTDFFSASHIKALARNWTEVKVFSENVGMSSIFQEPLRRIGLATIGRTFGLDIYCHLKK